MSHEVCTEGRPFCRGDMRAKMGGREGRVLQAEGTGTALRLAVACFQCGWR